MTLVAMQHPSLPGQTALMTRPRNGWEPVREVPAKSANKPEWVAYAVTQGLSEDEANALTKEQLVERYGA